jgi:transglutaminase-like putative cysteine protease
MPTQPDTGVHATPNEGTRVVTCDLALHVTLPAEVVVQIVAASSAGRVIDERFTVTVDGAPASQYEELSDASGERMHVIQADPGLLRVSYRSELMVESGGDAIPGSGPGAGATLLARERQTYLRPSRYCPSDHLTGFAVAEFGIDDDVRSRVLTIRDWIWNRIGYVPGSSDVHDSAEDTLLTGMGTCRDFAHLGVALCRATGIPARFVAVYAPGLSPMDFHAVFEAYQDGRWCVHDPTGLAPRPSLVRIATGRDAADTAFAAVNSGVASPESVTISATSGSRLPEDDHARDVQLP